MKEKIRKKYLKNKKASSRRNQALQQKSYQKDKNLVKYFRPFFKMDTRVTQTGLPEDKVDNDTYDFTFKIWHR